MVAEQAVDADREQPGKSESEAAGPGERKPQVGPESVRGSLRERKKKSRPYEGITGEVICLHEDIIGDRFWLDRPWLLA